MPKPKFKKEGRNQILEKMRAVPKPQFRKEERESLRKWSYNTKEKVTPRLRLDGV